MFSAVAPSRWRSFLPADLWVCRWRLRSDERIGPEVCPGRSS